MDGTKRTCAETEADDRIAAMILKLCEQRGVGKTICPSEVARALVDGDGDWRAYMTPVRRVAVHLVHNGRIAITQKGVPVDPDAVKGPIRLGLV